MLELTAHHLLLTTEAIPVAGAAEALSKELQLLVQEMAAMAVMVQALRQQARWALTAATLRPIQEAAAAAAVVVATILLLDTTAVQAATELLAY